MGDKAKDDGRDPSNDPQLSAVAGLRDLAQELLSNAENAGGDDQPLDQPGKGIA